MLDSCCNTLLRWLQTVAAIWVGRKTFADVDSAIPEIKPQTDQHRNGRKVAGRYKCVPSTLMDAVLNH